VKFKANIERAMRDFEQACSREDTGVLVRLQVLVESLEKDVANLRTALNLKQEELKDLKEEHRRQMMSSLNYHPRFESRCLNLVAVSAKQGSARSHYPEQIAHCFAYPKCKCIKARGPQACKLSRFGSCSVQTGDCIFRPPGAAGWGHVSCAIRNQS